MLSTEKAFELLPLGVVIFEKLNLKEYIKENKVEAKSIEERKVLEEEVPIKAVIYIIKNVNKIKEEVFEIIALCQDKDVETIRNQDVLITIKEFEKLIQTEDLISFFKLAMK